jgi:hypothetical protein
MAAAMWRRIWRLWLRCLLPGALLRGTLRPVLRRTMRCLRNVMADKDVEGRLCGAVGTSLSKRLPWTPLVFVRRRLPFRHGCEPGAADFSVDRAERPWNRFLGMKGCRDEQSQYAE